MQLSRNLQYRMLTYYIDVIANRLQLIAWITERNGRALCCVLRETRLLRHVLLAVRRRWSYVVTARVANVRIITHSGGIWITHACSATHSCEPSRNETCNTHSARPQSKRDSAVQLIAIPINVDLLYLLVRLFVGIAT